MKITVTYCGGNPDLLRLTLGEWGNLYIHKKYLEPLDGNEGWLPRFYMDVSTAVIIWPWQISLIATTSTWRTGEIKTNGTNLKLAVRRFLEVLRTLHTKGLSAELDTEDFKIETDEPKVLSVSELVKAAKGDGIALTLKHFKAKLKPALWPNLLRTLSDYALNAKLYAPCHFNERNEFYFDGRYKGGCGYNGGIILYGDEFGVHT